MAYLEVFSSYIYVYNEIYCIFIKVIYSHYKLTWLINKNFNKELLLNIHNNIDFLTNKLYNEKNILKILLFNLEIEFKLEGDYV